MNPWIVNLLRSAGSGGSAPPLTGRTLFAPLKSSLVPSEGTGSSTFSRATKAWGLNELGILREVPSGCAVFEGARLVRNLCVTKSEDFTNAAWTKTALTAPSANLLVCANSTVSQSILNTTSDTTTIGDVLYFRYRVQYVDIRYVAITPHSGSFGSGIFCNFDLVGKTVSATGCTGYITEISPNVFDIAIRATATAASSGATATLDLANSLASPRKDNFIGDGVKSIGVLRYSANYVTGYDASYVPEYVSVGSSVNKNFLLHTDDFSQAAWGKTNLTITASATANPINGIVNAQKIEATATASTSCQQTATGAGSSSGNVFVVYAKKGSGATAANKFILRNQTTATNLVGISLNYDTGAIAYLAGSSGATATNVGNGWYRIELSSSSGISTGDQMYVYAGFTGGSETAGSFCYVYRPYLGHGVTAPASISAVSGAWDPHGSNLDGAKYYETDWQGAPIPAANLLGFSKETAATNNLPHCRDLSNAAWSTKTNITAAKTATGLDGLANTATTLTATATDAIILQPITLSSAARCASAYVKRRTGTGTISFTQDGGSSWTDITSQINSSTYSRVQITSTLANPSVGFKISTSGDAIDIDVVQNEAGAVATSPIVTTTATVTRNAEVLTYQTASNWSDTAGTAFVEVAPLAYYGGAVGKTTTGLLLSTSNSGATASDGTNSVNGPSGTPGSSEKLAFRWGSGAMTVSSGGVIGTPGIYDGSMDLTVIGIGSSAAGCFKNVAIYNYAMTDAELQAVTA